MSLRAATGLDWDTSLEREDNRFDYSEARFVALGLIGDRLHVLVFTEGSREDAVHSIGLRPAEKARSEVLLWPSLIPSFTKTTRR